MPIDYLKESEKYRPKTIKTLLVGEAPPDNKTSYFYVPKPMSYGRPIEKDTSLPATIFHHYFKKRPETCEDYKSLLLKIQEKGIFLIDICDEPIKVRGNENGLKRIKKLIPRLRGKTKKRSITVDDKNIVFLLPRRGYPKPSYREIIEKHFPNANCYRWIDFRMCPELS